MGLKLLYRNLKWLYSVYCSEDQTQYILVAVFPGVGWEDVSLVLTPDEVRVFESDGAKFIEFVKQITNNRRSEPITGRRIQIRSISPSEIEIVGPLPPAP